MKVELNQDLFDLRKFDKLKKPSDLILNIISNSVSIWIIIFFPIYIRMLIIKYFSLCMIIEEMKRFL